VICASSLFGSAVAADVPFSDRLTGDWGGARATLAARGITIDFDSTHYYQGLISGTGDNDFEYGGRLDALVNFDTEKLGLWRGGVLRTHTEYRYGDLSPQLGGTLVSTNVGLLLPNGKHEDLVITSIHLAQRIGDRVNLLVGRISPIDLIAADPFFGGAGHSRFMNMAFAAPPSGVTPAVITGAIATIRAEPLSWTLMLFDPNDRTDDYWPDDFFGDGVSFSIAANYNGELMERTSSVTVSATYTTKDGANLGELLLPSDLQTGDKDRSWHLGVQFVQFLHQRSDRPGDGWGVFLKVNGSDGNPNPFQGSVMGGIGGKALFASRPNDTFGIGYFYVNFSDDLQSTLNPFVSFDDEQGLEAFYNFLATDWLMLSADLQYVNPALGDSDDAFIGGLRAKIRF
jgi:porin